MNCTRCNSQSIVKNGNVRGLQRFRCKECRYNFSAELKSTAKPMTMKRHALTLYLEGLGFNSIGRILGVSHVSVMNWIKMFGKEAMKLNNEHEAKIIEIDELHTYIKKKTTVGYGLPLIELGNNSSTVCLGVGERRQARSSGNL